MAAVIALSLQNKVSKTLEGPQQLLLKVTLNSAGGSSLCLFVEPLYEFFGLSCSHIVYCFLLRLQRKEAGAEMLASTKVNK